MLKDIVTENKKFFKDCKHVLWLTKVMLSCFLKGDIDGAEEAIFWIKMHWNYKSKEL